MIMPLCDYSLCEHDQFSDYAVECLNLDWIYAQQMDEMEVVHSEHQ